MTSALTPAGTPGSIHLVPSWINTQLKPLSAQQIQALAEGLLTGFEQWVALALLNVSVLGVHPFQALQAFGQDPGGVISTLIPAFGGVGSGLSALSTAVTSAISSLLSTTTWATFLSDANTALVTGGTDLAHLITGLGAIPGGNIAGALNTAITIQGALLSSLFNGTAHFIGSLDTTALFGGTALSTVLANITASTGALNAAGLSGAINTAVTLSGTALSGLFNGSAHFIGVLDATATGVLNTALTYSGTALSTVLTNITASTGALNAAGLAGALNPAVTFLVGASNIALSTLLQNLSATGTFVASALTGAINPAVTFLVGASNIALSTLLQNLSATGTLVGSAVTGALNGAVTLGGNAVSTLFNGSGLIASQIAGALNPAVTFLVGASNIALSTLLQNLSTTGTFVASALTGAINPAVTFLVGASNIALSTLLQNLSATGTLVASALTGAINTAVTLQGTALSSLFSASAKFIGSLDTTALFSGTALSTVLTNITASTGALNAAGLAGALNIAVTLRGVALSSLFNSSANFIGVIDAAATGALNSALTYSGTALSTVLTNITASTGALNAAGLSGALATAVTISGNAVSTLFNSSGVLASKLTGAINPAVTFLVGASNIALSTLLQNLNATGQLAGSALTGAINLAATIGGVALSTIFSGTGTFIGQLDAAATGALNSAITFAGTALSTVLTNITPSTGAIAGGGVTGLLATGNDIVTDVTNAVDNLVNVFTGGSGSGNTPAALPVAAAAIPHANIVPPANPGSTVSHDASANATPVTGTTNTLSITPYSHVVAVGGYLTVKVATLSSYVGALPAVVTFGGTPVPLLTPPSFAAYVVSGVFKIVTTAIYGLAVPAGATANVAVTAAAAAPQGNSKVYALQVESDSYLGVGSVGGAVATGGPSNASFTSANIASASGSWIVSSAAVIAESSETLSAYNKTSRYNPGSTFNSTAAAYLAMITGDATSSGSLIQFTATASYTTKNVWVSSAVNLIPSPVTILGSGFRQYRVSTTGVTLSNTGLTTPSLLPNSFFDTNDNVTSDLTSAPATANKLTFSNAAWYAVTICLYQPSGSASDVDLACALFKNGTAIRVGGFVDTKFVNSAQATFQVYLVAGDYLQPGYSCTAATPVIKGEATGIMCYWEVALMNRGILS